MPARVSPTVVTSSTCASVPSRAVPTPADSSVFRRVPRPARRAKQAPAARIATALVAKMREYAVEETPCRFSKTKLEPLMQANRAAETRATTRTYPMNVRPASSTAMARKVPASPPPWRCCGGSDSGTARTTASRSSTPSTASTAKTARQVETARTAQPRTGAATGATPITCDSTAQ